MTSQQYSLGTKLNLIGLLFFVIPVLAIGWLLSSSHYGSLVEVEKSHMVTLLEDSMAEYHNNEREAIRDARMLSEVPPIQGMMRALNDEGRHDPVDDSSFIQWRNRLEKIFRNVMDKKRHYLQVRFVGRDDDGREILRLDRKGDEIITVEEAKLQSKGQYEYVSKVLNEGDGSVWVSEVTLNRERGKIAGRLPVVRYSVPVKLKDASDNFGVLVINADFDEMLGNAQEGENDLTVGIVANSKGDILSHNDESLTFGFEVNKPVLLSDLYLDYPEGGQEGAPKVALLEKRGGDKEFVAIGVPSKFDDASGESLTFVVALDEDTVTASARASRLRAILITFGVAVGVFVALAFFTRSLTRPLRVACEVLSTIGEGDYDSRVDLGGSTELSELGDAINSMTEKLVEADSRDQNAWIVRESSLILSALQQAENERTWAESFCKALAKSLNAIVGQVCLVDSKETLAVPMATTGIDDLTSLQAIQLGQGHVGEALASKRLVAVNELPVGRYEIQTSLGTMHPNAILAFPLVNDGRVHAVVELALNEEVSERMLALLEQVSPSAILMLERVRSAKQTEELLRATQDQSYELEAQKENLAKAVGDLEEKATLLENSSKELEVAKAVAESANRAKSDFLANMSHEIRTPLNAVIGLSHLAQQGDIREDQREFLEKIEHSAKSLLGIINDILDFSKIEAGMIRLESTPFGLAKVLDSVAAILAGDAKEKGIELIFAAEPNVPGDLIGDPLRLEQILLNLTKNAIKFTQEGHVIVRVKLMEDLGDSVSLEFRVRDSGIGMRSEDIQRLFQPFEQADSSTSRNFGGTGLGLTIVRRLVEAQNGSFEVRSEVGSGSTFKIVINYQVQEPRGQMLLSPLVDASEGETRILIIDDVASVRMALTRMVESLGFSAIPVNSPELALKQLKDDIELVDRLSGVLLDWNMPGMNGLEFYRRVCEEVDGMKSVPVVLVTAFGSEDMRESAKKVGIRQVVNKPVTPSMVSDALAAALYSRKATSRIGGKIVEVDYAGRLKGVRLLVAEDNLVNQHVVRGILERAGALIEMVGDGAEAIKSAAAGGFHAILMDIQMPNVDGLAATKAIIAAQGKNAPPIIAMTAHALSEDHHRSMDAGMVAHVTKPLDPNFLVETILAKVGESEPSQKMPDSEVIEKQEDELHVLNTDFSLMRLGNDEELYKLLINEALSGIAKDRPLAEEALEDGDIEEAASVVHRLRGAALEVGGEVFAHAAMQLEVLLRLPSTPSSEAITLASEDFSGALDTYHAAIQEWVDEA